MQIVCLLIDRIDKADDNAEFLYRWLRANKPEVKLYFGLQKSAADWNRLHNDGFNLIDLDHTAPYKEILSNVTHILVSNPVKKNKNLAPNAIRIFLQHGITNRRAKASADYVNDCAKWADYIVATSEAEKTLLTTAPYTADKNRVAVTGFPRHDSLCAKAQVTRKKYICFQPHWAMYLKDEQVLSSIYFNEWAALLRSKELKEYCEQTGIKLAFRLHPCSYKFEASWRSILPPYIKYIDRTESFQKTFAESLLYVSDYSSNMFEVGIIDTPCIYYRPDAEYIRKHTTAGDFEKGILGIIGPATYNITQFISVLKLYTVNNFRPDPGYQATRNLLFPYKLNMQNCERVYNQLILRTAGEVPKHKQVSQDQNAYGKPDCYLYF